MGGECSTHEGNRESILMGKSEGKRPFGRPSRRWEGNIRIALREILWKIVDSLRIGTSGGICEHNNET